MKNKKISGLGMILVIAILATSTVFAFGVSSPYWQGNPLGIYPGETKTVKIGYQNMGTDVENLNVMAEITKGNEIASLSRQDYFVAANTKDTQVEIIVSVPTSAEIGAKYQVTLTSRTVTPGTEGGVGLGMGMDTTFDVLVIQRPPAPAEKPQEQLAEESTDTTWIIVFVLLAIIIISIILLVIFNARKKGKKNK